MRRPSWAVVRLGDATALISSGSTPRGGSEVYLRQGPVMLIRSQNVRMNQLSIEDVAFVTDEIDADMDRTRVSSGDVLLNITGASIGRVAAFELERKRANVNQHVCIIRPKPEDLLGRYLAYVMSSAPFQSDINRLQHGGTRQALTFSQIANFRIPLPPLPEQRRIAEILDRADTLRAKRRAALAQLDTLTQSIFLDMFGDPVTNPRRWPCARLESVLDMPLRNGLSPSHAGKVTNRVLTLSAITGGGFDSTAVKTGTFQSVPPSDQTVDERDFLVCRGNGNLRLVGKGYFPTGTMLDVAFPDTMIAARPSRERIGPAFLQVIWNSGAIRRQIESLARTTNGTFKVNQTMLEGIVFVTPPLDLQREFARRVAGVEKLKATHRASLAQLDALFASLQHRAFRGEL